MTDSGVRATYVSATTGKSGINTRMKGESGGAVTISAKLSRYIFVLFILHRQDIIELKEELSEERSKRTFLEVSGDALTF